MVDLLAGANQMLRRYLVARGVSSVTTRVDGHFVHHYTVRGTGSLGPIVLVHGLGGSANGFYKVILPLTRHFSAVHAVDLPGNGFSPMPPGGIPTLEDQYSALVEFLQRVVGEPGVVVGNSLGGAMSVKLAHEHAEWVRALCLIAPAGARVAQARMEEVIQSMTVTTTAQARALTRKLFHQAPVTALLFASELRKQYGTQMVKAFLESRRHLEYLSEEVLSSVKPPTLLLWGQSEKLLPYEGIEYFRAHLPQHAEIRIVEQFGHVPQMERPAEVTRHLVDFAQRTLTVAATG